MSTPAPSEPEPHPTRPDDWRLLGAEIRASTAYTEALVDPGILTADERDKIAAALKQIESELKPDPADQDMFAALDARLLVIAGPVAGRLSAGRSRNERVMTALRLWLLDEMEGLGEATAGVQRALLVQAESHVATLMPGYTHFQPAGVIACGHWLLSYFWMLARDQERLTGTIGRTSTSPLGSGSLAGTPYRIDRKALATALGFGAVTENSIDAVGDSDFAAEFLFVAVLIGIHLSRLAEDLIVYSNPAFGFVTIDDAYSAGSNLVPHKRNPEAVELSRAKAGRMLGELTGFLSTLKGLPSAYNQDAQENRYALYTAVDTLADMLSTMEGVIETLTVHPDRMYAALNDRVLVTDVADYLVARGVAFSDAYQIVEKLLSRAEKSGVPISQLPLDDFQAESPSFAADVFSIFDYSRSAAQRATIGGTAPAAIRAQIRGANNWLVETGLE
ncbi:MAG TPA: argininosuccinate lyase [Aggregatilineales bacterium]|nr:argininosuccinate lyase [Aggregatilineales bacterium]